MVRLTGRPEVPKECTNTSARQYMLSADRLTTLLAVYNKRFVMLCTFGINDGKFERVKELLVNNTKHAREEEQPGTISYRWYHNVDKTVVFVYEEYASIEGYNVSRDSPSRQGRR